MKKSRFLISGFSMIEVLVILIAIPVLAIISTQSLINVLSSQRKVEAEIMVRGNVEHIFSYIERRILNAEDVTVTYPSSNVDVIEYTNINGTKGSFVCTRSLIVSGKIEHEAITGSGLVRLSDSDIDIYECNFTEVGGLGNVPKGVRLIVGARIEGTEGAEGGQLELTTIVHTRSY